VPAAPGARTGGAHGGASGAHGAARARGLAPLLARAFACADAGNVSTACGALLRSAARAGDAAASVFKAARAAGRFVGAPPCTCAAAAAGGGAGGSGDFEVCVDAALAAPDAPDARTAGLAPAFAAAALEPLAACAPAAPCAAWPRGDGAPAPPPGAAAALSDFGPLAPDTLTLPQAFFYARRAEVLAHAWAGDGAGGRDAAVALNAGTGPVVALLNICGCGAVARL